MSGSGELPTLQGGAPRLPAVGQWSNQPPQALNNNQIRQVLPGGAIIEGRRTVAAPNSKAGCCGLSDLVCAEGESSGEQLAFWLDPDVGTYTEIGALNPGAKLIEDGQNWKLTRSSSEWIGEKPGLVGVPLERKVGADDPQTYTFSALPNTVTVTVAGLVEKCVFDSAAGFLQYRSSLDTVVYWDASGGERWIIETDGAQHPAGVKFFWGPFPICFPQGEYANQLPEANADEFAHVAGDSSSGPAGPAGAVQTSTGEPGAGLQGSEGFTYTELEPSAGLNPIP